MPGKFIPSDVAELAHLLKLKILRTIRDVLDTDMLHPPTTYTLQQRTINGQEIRYIAIKSGHKHQYRQIHLAKSSDRPLTGSAR